MKALPSGDVRTNVGTWAVPTEQLPEVGSFMHDAARNESYDPRFHGQEIETYYLDTAGQALRKARLKGERYLTLRIRCYDNGEAEAYAISAKTEAEKWRADIEPRAAEALLLRPDGAAGLLPANLRARLDELAKGEPLGVCVKVCCRRYAVEDATDRYTLDVGVETDTGLCLPAHVLEYKSTDPDAVPPAALAALGLRPVKLSKFLWSTVFARRD